MSDINVPLMRKTLEFITEHPDQHDQDHWGLRTECGTTACMAGWAVQLAGGELIFGTAGEAQKCLHPEDGLRRTEYAAQDLLNLTSHQANEMFWSANTISDLWAMAERFTDGEIIAPDGLEGPA